jgi:RimJ/RimL family protein N-acetyltransferase
MEIRQRTATLDDADLLLNWRNDQSAREFSLNSNLIQIDEHLQWLSARLKRIELEPFYLFIAEGEVVGMSRLEIVSGLTDVYEISILIDPYKQGRGLGAKILDMTCKSFFRLHPNKSINALVHKNNHVSQRLFLSAGFQLKTPIGDFINYEKAFKID